MKILITSPYYRCGSTLVQRCFHQCNDTIIYGEMNSLFSSIDNLIKSANAANSESMINFYEKKDADYCRSYPSTKIYEGIYAMLGQIFPAKTEAQNIGLKTVGETYSSLMAAISLGFKILYVHRNYFDAAKSYFSQSWASVEGFNLTYERSKSVNNKQRLQELESEGFISQLRYEDIHDRIFDILDSFQLTYDKEKIQSVLSNKINPGS